MGGPVAVLLILLIVAAVAIVWFMVRRRRPADLPARIRPVVAAARRRALIAVLFSVVVLLGCAVVGVAFPALLGMPFAVAPLVSGAAGMLLYAATRPRAIVVPEDAPRSAGLARRSWLSAIPGHWLHAWVEITVLFVAVVVFCGITASADDQGRSRAIRFESPEQTGVSTPYPGWFYGIPALIALALLIAATVFALHRIGEAAAFPDPEDAEADAQWRRTSASVILKLSTGSMLFSLGGIAITAGMAARNAFVEATSALWSVVADALWIGGILFFVLSVVSVTLAALTAFTIGERMARTPEPVR
jgi:heme/copper-type cytochrome/quinol oxidase subunit 2